MARLLRYPHSETPRVSQNLNHLSLPFEPTFFFLDWLILYLQDMSQTDLDFIFYSDCLRTNSEI